jgi:hypothetical protein
VFGIDFAQTPFSKEIATQIVDKGELLEQYNMLTPEEVASKQVEPHPFLAVHITPQFIAMIGVFTILLLVLGVLLFMQR